LPADPYRSGIAHRVIPLQFDLGITGFIPEVLSCFGAIAANDPIAVADSL